MRFEGGQGGHYYARGTRSGVNYFLYYTAYFTQEQFNTVPK